MLLCFVYITYVRLARATVSVRTYLVVLFEFFLLLPIIVWLIVCCFQTNKDGWMESAWNLRWKLKHANSIRESFELQPNNKMFMFMLNVIKIDPYNFKLYRFKKVCAFLRQYRPSLLLLLIEQDRCVHYIHCVSKKYVTLFIWT